MSYIYNTAPAGGAAQAYPHSPYAAPGSAPGAQMHSPYVAAGQQPATMAAYPHSPYQPTAGSTLAPGAYPGQMTQPSPMAAQTYLPSGGQMTMAAGGAMTASTTPAQQTQPFAANVTPGSVTYTTTTDALGRVTYHHFRADPSTYRSPQGVTYTGIQWVPTETSSVPPIGVAPAGPDVLAAFRGQFPTATGTNASVTPTSTLVGSPTYDRDYRDDSPKSTKEWEMEERRRRKEEKAAMKRNAAWEAERLAREEAEDREMRASRMRRPSHGAGLGADLASGAGAYARERSRDRGSDLLRERELRDREERELERRMGDLNVSARGGYRDEYGAPLPGTRSRRQSVSIQDPAGIYDDPGYERERDGYESFRPAPRSSIYAAPERTRDINGTSERSRPNSIYAAAPERQRQSRPSSMYAGMERSPYRHDASLLPTTLGPDGVEVYPPGHINAGQPISGYAPSRNHSPVRATASYRNAGYGGASPRPPLMGGLSPRVGAGAIPGVSPRLGGGAPLGGAGEYGAPPPGQLLAMPEAFNRPINRAQSFTPFKDLRVQELDELAEDIIKPMPAVLGTHDMVPEDWLRLMSDIGLAWKNKLPLPADGPVRRADLVIDLLELWNSAFLVPRCCEVVLYKGRNCKSGPGAGRPETRLATEDLFGPGEFSDEEEDESDEEDEEEYAGQYGGGYGRNRSASRRSHGPASRRKQKLEAKVQREMELGKLYTLWLKYVPPREYGREY